MLYNAFGWEFKEPANYIYEVIAERGDSNMSWAVFPWVFERYHGCETDHAGMAQYLAAHLCSIMGWTAAPQDGDSVEVSISFRDQGGGEFNNPIAETKETMSA